MSAQVSLFLRDDRVIVIPQGGGGGFSYDIEPSLIVSPRPDEVEKAISEALETSRQAQDGTPPEKRSAASSPLLKKLGLRSFKAFYRGASHCYLYEEDGILTMLRFKPASDGGGFDLASPPPESIEDRGRVGSIVLEYLQSAPKMPSS